MYWMYACAPYTWSQLFATHFIFQQIKICNVFEIRAVCKWKCYCFYSIPENQFYFFFLSLWDSYEVEVLACKRVLILYCSSSVNKVWLDEGGGGGVFKCCFKNVYLTEPFSIRHIANNPTMKSHSHTYDAKNNGPTQNLVRIFFFARMYTTLVSFFSFCFWLQFISVHFGRLASLHPTEFIQCIVYITYLTKSNWRSVTPEDQKIYVYISLHDMRSKSFPLASFILFLVRLRFFFFFWCHHIICKTCNTASVSSVC